MVAQGLIPSLVRQHSELVLFTSTPSAFSSVAGLRIRRVAPLGLGRSIARTALSLVQRQFSLAAAIEDERCTIAFYPYTNEALLHRLAIAKVITVHDTLPLLFPEQYPVTAWVWRLLTLPTLRRAAAVVADSQSTKRDVVRFAGIDEGRVTVIPLGFRSLAGTDGCSPEGIPASQPYVLYVSSGMYPYKNIGTLARAMSLLPVRLPHRLVIVGSRPPRRLSAALDDAIETSGAANRITVLDRVTDAELGTLYSKASAFVYPSKYEGFGLPLLEAMAHRLPIVASNASSIPEVCGDAAVLVASDSPSAFARGMSQVIEDPALRERLIAAGLVRLSQFSWDQTAERIVTLCHSVSASL